MKYFIEIYDQIPNDEWGQICESILYIKKPNNIKEMNECLTELNFISKCDGCGRCCLTAPQLTDEEKIKHKINYPSKNIIHKKSCPFRTNHGCELHNSKNKPLQCRSYVCQPNIRNILKWLFDFNQFFKLEI